MRRLTVIGILYLVLLGNFTWALPPQTPSDPTPADGADWVPGIEMVFFDNGWLTSSEFTTFDFYLGPQNPPPLFRADLRNNFSSPYVSIFAVPPFTYFTLGTTYYWQVVLKNADGTTSGPIWKFRAVPAPPFPPINPSPANGATSIDIDITLSWADYSVVNHNTGSEASTYDVYFGTNNPPPFVKSQTNTSYNPGTLNLNTTYYWQIFSNNLSGSAPGPIWSFKTKALRPAPPINPNPSNGATSVSVHASLSWSDGGSGANAASGYEIYFGTSNPPPLVASNQINNNYNPGPLEFRTTYYWQIFSRNDAGFVPGPIWNFTTQLPPPSLPINPTPSIEARDISIFTSLSWADGGSGENAASRYDVYFGTRNPPPLVVSDQINTTYDPGNLHFDTIYYWQIISKNNNGATPGNIWNFKTRKSKVVFIFGDRHFGYQQEFYNYIEGRIVEEAIKDYTVAGYGSRESLPLATPDEFYEIAGAPDVDAIWFIGHGATSGSTSAPGIFFYYGTPPPPYVAFPWVIKADTSHILTLTLQSCGQFLPDWYSKFDHAYRNGEFFSLFDEEDYIIVYFVQRLISYQNPDQLASNNQELFNLNYSGLPSSNFKYLNNINLPFHIAPSILARYKISETGNYIDTSAFFRNIPMTDSIARVMQGVSYNFYGIFDTGPDFIYSGTYMGKDITLNENKKMDYDYDLYIKDTAFIELLEHPERWNNKLETGEVSIVNRSGKYSIQQISDFQSNAIFPISIPPQFINITAVPSPAHEGDNISISFTSSESLQTSPTVTVNNNLATTQTHSGLNYTYSYKVKASDPDGSATIVIAGTNLAGLTGGTSSTSALVIEKQAAANVTLTVASAHGTPTPVVGTHIYASGTSVTASVTSPVPGPAGTRQVCTGWAGTGAVPASGTGTTVDIRMDQDSNITWQWKTQYQLTTAANPSNGGAIVLDGTNTPAAGWYDAGSRLTVRAIAAKGYHFTGWSGDLAGSVNPANLVMDAPRSILAQFVSRSGEVIHVDGQNGLDSNDGLNWAAAKKTIQAALASASTLGIPQVWVKKGTYRETIVMPSNLGLYGGFAGGETRLNDRSTTANLTLIDAHKARHVVQMQGLTSTTLDGFTLTGGYCTYPGTGSRGVSGAGLLAENLDHTNVIANCIFKQNIALYGGAMHLENASPIIRKCVFSQNLATRGGAVDAASSSAEFHNCMFLTNSAFRGATLHAEQCDHISFTGCKISDANSPDTNIVLKGGLPRLDRCIISGNHSDRCPGIYTDQSSPQITNCILNGNVGDAGIILSGGMPSIINCDIVSNGRDGIVFSTSTNATISNCIFASNQGYGIRKTYLGSAGTLNHSLFHGNKRGDYSDPASPTAYIGAASLNANEPGGGNVDGPPAFLGGAIGTWMAAPQCDVMSSRTLLIDGSAAFTPGSLMGSVITPDIRQYYQTLVLDNTTTGIWVAGDIRRVASSGATYQLFDYRLGFSSAAIDTGTIVSAPKIDFDGNPRPVDIPGRGASGLNAFDIGAYEAQLIPIITVSPGNKLLDFGHRAIGAGPSAPQDVVSTNRGFSSLHFIDDGFSLGGPDPSDFHFVNPPIITPLDPGTSRSVSLAFQPTEVGPRTALLDITTDAPDTPLVQIAMGGIGTPPPTPTPTPTPDPSLVGYWKFNESTGTTALDSSGKNNTGIIIGATRTTGKVGGALNFQSGNAHVAISASTSLSLATNRVTFACWVYPTKLSSSWSTIIQRSNAKLNWFDWQIYARAGDAPTPGRPVFRVSWNNNLRLNESETVQSNNNLVLNQWQFVACSYDGRAMYFYVNGTLRGKTTKNSGQIPNSGRPIWIGANENWGEPFRGYIDEFRIYNRALSQTEIQALMVQQ